MTTPQEMLHPDIVAAIGDMSFVGMNAEVLAMIRGVSFDAPLSDAVERTDHVVPGSDGEPDVVVRVHRPTRADTSDARACLYSIHGGGYVMGSFSMDDPMFDRMCPKFGLVGVSVEYRLAPETAYPGPLEDCYRGLKWTHDHAGELGIDARRIGIRGISAGGGLAAALALLARDRGDVPVAFQILDCPMLDDRQATASSQQDGLPVWSRESNTFGWQSYLGDLYGGDDLPYTAAPGRATVDELRGLPPAFVSVGSIDGFLDEDVDYALRLNRAGVPTELHVYPGACHGYQMAQQCEITRQSTRDIEDWLGRHLRVAG